MEVHSLANFTGGWFLGNFVPSVATNPNVEVCLKRYPKGTIEPMHYQLTATEYTLVISGRCRIGSVLLQSDEILCIPPLEAADFEALEDVVLVAVKTPSLPSDKVLGEPT